MATAATTAGAYVRHDPTQTTLHALVAKHVETFLAFAEERSGRALPRYVVEEFHGYLRCGVLAHGFGRARCSGGGHDMLVAFSCKLRGVCPSCGGRRMCQTAATVCDRVLPDVPLRLVGDECPVRAAEGARGRPGDADADVAGVLRGTAPLVPRGERHRAE